MIVERTVREGIYCLIVYLLTDTKKIQQTWYLQVGLEEIDVPLRNKNKWRVMAHAKDHAPELIRKVKQI